MALYSLCGRCGTKIQYRTRYCDRCKTKEDAERIEMNKARSKKYNSDRYLRDKANEDRIRMFYVSNDWRKKRYEIIRRDNDECVICKALCKFIPIEDVHHIIPMTKDFSKRLDNDNLIGLCKYHHQQIHYHNIDNKDKLNKYVNQLINSDKFVKKLLNINIQK